MRGFRKNPHALEIQIDAEIDGQKNKKLSSGSESLNTSVNESSINIAKTDDDIDESFAYILSKAHFTSSINEYINRNSNKSPSDIVDMLYSQIDNFSKLYKDIHTIKKCQDNLTDKTAREGSLTLLRNRTLLGQFILDVIKNKEKLSDNSSKHLLLLRSPVGSYKNRLLQYIYLYLYHCSLANPIDLPNHVIDSSILPIYISMSVYENFGTSKIDSGKSLDINALLEYLSKIVKKANINNKTPIIIFDNVRSFECGIEQAYDEINNFVNNGSNNCYIITGVDSLTTTTNRRYCGELASSDNYDNIIKISSLNLDREQESIDFIQNCVKIFECNNIGSEDLRAQFIKLKLVALDAYIVKKMLVYIKTKVKNSIIDESLPEIYGNYIENNIDDECFKEAYHYDYDDDKFNSFQKMPSWWNLATEHRSIFDYFIARYYYNCLKETLKSNICLPDVVLTNSINRFLISMIKPNEWIELVEYINKNNASLLSNACCGIEKTIAQLCFLIGRVPKACDRHLNVKNIPIEKVLFSLKDSIEQYLNATEGDTDDLKINCFLLRTITVDLIKRGKVDILNEYMNSLTSDPIAAEVNRGYHLDYYGDFTVDNKKAIVSSIGVVLTDNNGIGINSLRKLSLELERDLDKDCSKEKLCMLTLNLFTYCELIQTRKIPKALSNIKNHQKNCLRFLNKFLERTRECGFELNETTLKYFSEMRDSLELDLNKNPMYHKLTSELSKERTGWMKRNISNGESIAEHMYNTWLMASIYLPEKYDGEQGFEGAYSKESILKLLLVHDVGEAQIGDIIQGEKQFEQKEQEKEVLESYVKYIFPSSTADKIGSMWKGFEDFGSKDINARIAKDIDRIQAVYRYCCYVNMNSNLFNQEDWNEWITNLQTSTLLGSKIVNDAILNNPEFLVADPLAKCIKQLKSQGISNA